MFGTKLYKSYATCARLSEYQQAEAEANSSRQQQACNAFTEAQAELAPESELVPEPEMAEQVQSPQDSESDSVEQTTSSRLVVDNFTVAPAKDISVANTSDAPTLSSTDDEIDADEPISVASKLMTSSVILVFLSVFL